MAVVYRPHRYLLPDAMKELRAFESKKQMLEELSKEPFAFNLHVDKSHNINDGRTGWKRTCFIMGEYNNEKYVYGACDIETYKYMSRKEARESTLNTYKKWGEEEK